MVITLCNKHIFFYLCEKLETLIKLKKKVLENNKNYQ